MKLPERKGPTLLPGVSPEMLQPEFWCAKFADFYLDSDWIGISRTPAGQIPERIFNSIKQWNNLYNQDGSILAYEKAIQGSTWWDSPEYGLLTKSGDLKLLPREAPLFSSKEEPNLDRNQLSGLDLGDRLNLFGISTDGKWYAATCDSGIGWIKREIIGIGSENEVQTYQNEPSRMVMIGPYSRILTENEVIGASMGCSFPLNDHIRQTIVIPDRNTKERLGFKTGIIIDGAVRDHLPKTAHNLIRQAFKYLGYPYAWGDWDSEGSGRDCSRLVKDVLQTMGFKPPRNSREQLTAGKKRIKLKGMNLSQRLNRLKRIAPGSLLFTPGHVMIFLGINLKEAYIIHALLSYRKINGKEEPVKVKQAVVSGLSLGMGTSTRSLLEQLTEVVEV